MTDRCPRCYGELTGEDRWVCPSCGYTLRTPTVSKVGLVVMFLGLVLLGTYVMGPESIGLTGGMVPTDLANMLIANYPLFVAGVFGFGMLLLAVGALAIRRARNLALAA